jgi:glycogen debranching enzyme
MSIFADLLNKSNEYESIAENVKASFLSQYIEQYDVIDTKNVSCRPNKLFLVAVDHIMINNDIQSAIVSDVRDRLITIFGPRTLSKDHPNYKGFYIGNYPRDITYHNGMVWPWLLGPFISAYIKINHYSNISRKNAYNQFLKPLLHVYGNEWDGSIHEIFDGDPIFEPHGCINQAWSVAEILRAWVEDVLAKRPNYEKKYNLNKIRI